jgi:hypothetical protein
MGGVRVGVMYKGVMGHSLGWFGRICGRDLTTGHSYNAGKDCIHKTQSGRALPCTRHKQGLRVPGYPFII